MKLENIAHLSLIGDLENYTNMNKKFGFANWYRYSCIPTPVLGFPSYIILAPMC